MKMRALRCTVSAAFICVAAACGGAELSVPTSPSSTVAASSPPSPLPPIPFSPFPPIARPARVYAFAEPLSYQVRDWTLDSRFVLYDDHTFALQYTRSRGSFEYRGRYAESDGSINFDWDGWSTAGPWGATATITTDLLTVRYNLIMQMSDFEDAVYRRTSTSSQAAP